MKGPAMQRYQKARKLKEQGISEEETKPREEDFDPIVAVSSRNVNPYYADRRFEDEKPFRN